MRNGDVLFFSPTRKFSDLKFDDAVMLVDAFRERVEGFFLNPAERSIGVGDAFAAGIVCCAAIEFIAKVSCKDHPCVWLQRNVAGFTDEKLANRFWVYFRDGLAHEGRIKSYGGFSGQFSLELGTMSIATESVLIVNPRLLLGAVKSALGQYCEQMTPEQSARLGRRLHHYFDAEIKSAKG